MTHKIVLNGSWFWIHSVGSERFLKSTNAEMVYKTILRINIEEEICWQDKGCEERRRQWWKEQWKTNSSGKDYKENTILIKILTMLLRAFWHEHIAKIEKIPEKENGTRSATDRFTNGQISVKRHSMFLTLEWDSCPGESIDTHKYRKEP